MKIYIVRHGESEGNAGEFISYSFTPLTLKGHKDAERLGRRMKEEKIKVGKIYCSSLYRSLQTLEDLLKGGLKTNKKNIEITDLLGEINRKEFEGKNRTLYYAKKEASPSPEDYRPSGGESESDVKKRAQEFLSLIQETGDKSILIVTHGHFLRHFMELLGLTGLGRLQGASLSLIQTDFKKSKVIFWNDASHLN